MPTTDGRRVRGEDRRTPRRRWVPGLVILGVVAVLVATGLAGYRKVTEVAFSPTCQATAAGSPVSFSPEQTANAALISAISVRRQLPARAATIAVATAIQESKLRNLRYGDRDSLGLFQQRPSQGWGTESQILDPAYATGRFYDALVKVKDYGSREITQVAQEVQRSGFPEAYADHEQEGRILASTLTGRSAAGLGCRLKPVEQAGDGAVVVADLQAQLGVTASQQGTQVTLTGSNAEQAWAAGQWAVARAEAYGIDRVQVGGQAWQRSQDQDALTWVGAPAGETPTSVTIRMGTPRA